MLHLNIVNMLWAMPITLAMFGVFKGLDMMGFKRAVTDNPQHLLKFVGHVVFILCCVLAVYGVHEMLGIRPSEAH